MRKSLLIACAIIFTNGIYANINEYIRANTVVETTIDSRAASCNPSSEKLFMEFNNVRAVVETAGFLWEERATVKAGYEYPKGSNSFVLFSGALWMGGEDANGQLKLAAHRFRDGNDFWAGPLAQLGNKGNYNPFVPQEANLSLVRDNGAGTINCDACNKYDQFFTIRKIEVLSFIRYWNCANDVTDSEDCEDIGVFDSDIYDRIKAWPAHGDTTIGEDFYLAPFFDNSTEENPANGYYDPVNDGDYPWYDIEGNVSCKNDRRVTLYGDETHWWVFNDKGNIHTETGGAAIGMEIRAQAFSFATDDEINDMTFYNYELINRGTQVLKNTYFGQYVDPDIGLANNDFVGCDVTRGLGYCYNGTLTDPGQDGQTPYGANPPAVGIDFFEGPYQDNDNIDNPIYKPVADTLPAVLLPEVAANKGMPYEGLGIGYGDGIVDNERFGMQRFVYYNNTPADNGDPESAEDYYKYLKGVWKNNNNMTFGGDGFNPANSTSIPTKFMYPGDSDPLSWGTYPTNVSGSEEWTEITAENPAEDRRFVQSAGPFTLKPGAVNNITVGVVIGKSNESDIEAPIRALKTADTKAQNLFDNCFEVLEPPYAPDLNIQELENKLILVLTDPKGVDPLESFVAEDFRIETPKELLDSGIVYDNKFKFEGFQIYQMRNATSSISQLDDINEARIVAQSDIVNGIGRLINFTLDDEIGESIPMVMVDKAGDYKLDKGLRRSFVITEDLFAENDRTLVNHKKYYYIAVSYSHNEFLKYDPDDDELNDGQKEPYLRSRSLGSGREITSIIGIPHDPSPEANGRKFTTDYGFQPEITQIEGEGNGGIFLELSTKTVDQILIDNKVDHPIYKTGAGPINIKVIDPLVLKGGLYTLGFETDSASLNDDFYWIERFADGQRDTIWSDQKISVVREQLFLEWGISVFLEQKYYEGNDISLLYTEPISATITFADSSKNWLGFVEDDDRYYPSNWILSGTNKVDEPESNGSCVGANWIFQECHYDDVNNLDNEFSYYEKLLGGGIAPFRFVGKGFYGAPYGFPGEDTETPWYQSNESWFASAETAQKKARLNYLHDVDIIITKDKTKWTRCPVIEINDNIVQTEHEDWILQPRSDKSVDKQGKSQGETGYVSAEGDLVNATGMGWFPGYALDVNTGERLNMIFSENSWLGGDNGDDMVWNPTSNYSDPTGNPTFGGMHYVYVFGTDVDGSDSPAYDNGSWLRSKLSVDDTGGSSSAYLSVWKSCFWVMEPMLNDYHELMATDVKISARINKPYVERDVNGENQGYPMYQFSFDNPSIINDADRLISVIDNINVVPNPYYAYSAYELTKRDNRVKITNLPERCEVTIFNMQGALVRSFIKDDPLTSLEWDLKNHKNIPIAGGMYIIHVKMEIPDENGIVQEYEKILKWYGVLRKPDLDNL